MDIGDLGTERLSYRRLRVLISHLPRESSYVQDTLGDLAQWGSIEHLLASVIDGLTMLNHNFVQSKSKQRLPKATFVQRPGVPKRDEGGRRIKGSTHSMADMRAILNGERGDDGN